MSFDSFVGGIFKIPFPFTDLSTNKARPALAVSEPDEYGDIEFLFITTKQSRYFGKTIDVPGGLLPFDSKIHIDKKYLLSKNIIIKKIAEIDNRFLEKILKQMAFMDTKRYYKFIHIPKQTQEFIKGKSRINYAGRVYDDKELISLVDSALDFWLTAGRFARQFEDEFAKFLGVKHCLLTNSGSSANLLAISALTSPELGKRQLKPGDEVITVAAGFPTTVNPIIQNNLIPVFIDVNLGTYNIAHEKIEEAISDKTKAIFLAHTMGNPFNLNAIMKIAKKHDLWLIEDNCDALGSKYNGKYTGTFGHIATFSFYPAHHITMGEGGALVTNDTNLKRLIESFRDWGRDCWCEPGCDNTCGKRFGWQLGKLPYGYDHKYIYSHIGYNLKVTDMQAAVGVEQLKKLPSFIAARKKNFKLLYDGLKKYEQYFILPEVEEKADPSWFGFLLTVREGVGFTKNEIVKYLEENKIATRMLFAGNIIRHPSFKDVEYRVYGNLMNTDCIIKDTFWIGVYPGLTDEMIEYELAKFEEFISICRQKYVNPKEIV